VDAEPEPQAIVWERMNLPIARGLRGLLYVLEDLSQVDPSDLSMLFAGPGRLRMGFAELDVPTGEEPGDREIHEAARRCWDNPYYGFGKPVGTSLICIQGDWSNVVDGKIKSQLAALSQDGGSDGSYNPLYARTIHAPRPWGVTALFAEDTGKHPPLEIDWPRAATRPSFEATEARGGAATVTTASGTGGAARKKTSDPASRTAPSTPPRQPAPADKRIFTTFKEFTLALERSDPAATALAGSRDARGIPIDGAELRKLLDTMWFRAVLPQLSQEWRERILEVLAESVPLTNHALTVGRHTVHVSELTLEQMKEILAQTLLPDGVRADLQLLVTVGSVWGEQALRRIAFSNARERATGSRLSMLLQPFRSS
jgi:hypothetical protein